MDEQENQKDENIHLRRFLRVLANVLITCSLGGSGYLIYFVVKRSQEFATRDDLSWYEKNEVMMLRRFLMKYCWCCSCYHQHCKQGTRTIRKYQMLNTTNRALKEH